MECTSSLVGLVSHGVVALEETPNAELAFAEQLTHASEIVPTEPVRENAEGLAWVDSLRTAGTMQFAAALVWARQRLRGLELVFFDTRLHEVSRLEGFVVLPTESMLFCSKDITDRQV